MKPVPPTKPSDSSGRRRLRYISPVVERDMYAGRDMKNVMQDKTPRMRAIVMSVVVRTRLR